MTQQAFFEYVVTALEAAEIPYMITGSVAAMAYGEPRLTNDLDVVVLLAPRHIPAFRTAFQGDAFYVPDREVILDEIRHRGQFNVLHIDSGSKVDFILCKNTDFARNEFSRRQVVRLTADTESQSATPEDVILSKLAYYKEGRSRKHLDDIAGILRIGIQEIDEAYIQHWAEELELSAEWDTARQHAAQE